MGFFKKPKWVNDIQKGAQAAVDSTVEQTKGGVKKLEENIEKGGKKLGENVTNIAQGKVPGVNDISKEAVRARENTVREAKAVKHGFDVNLEHMTPEQRAVLIAVVVAAGGYAIVTSNAINWSIGIAFTTQTGGTVTVPVIGTVGSGALIAVGADVALRKKAEKRVEELKIDNRKSTSAQNTNALFSPNFEREKIMQVIDPILDKGFDWIISDIEMIANVTCGVMNHPVPCTMAGAIFISKALFGHPKTIGESKTFLEDNFELALDLVKGKLLEKFQKGRNELKLFVGYTWEQVEAASRMFIEVIKREASNELKEKPKVSPNIKASL